MFVPRPEHRHRRRRAQLLCCGLPAVVALTVAQASTADAAAARGSRRLDVRAGGPYRAKAGSLVTLQATYAVAGQSKTVDDLKAIGAALKAYEKANGSYPPAALSDASGKPLLSWRVLLLPYLGQGELYKRFDLTKAWNDPANASLVAQMPAVFRSSGAARGSSTTDYAGVAGRDQIFQSAQPRLDLGVRRTTVIDGIEMTIAVGPVGSSVKIPWTSPGDVDVARNATLGSPNGFDAPGSVVTPLLFLDGIVRPIPDSTDPYDIQSWSTIAGGGCSPPDGLELKLSPQWDLDGSGKFATYGSVATLSATKPGSRTVKFRVVDDLGGVHVTTARVVVR